MKKKILSFLLAICLSFPILLCSCKENNTENQPNLNPVQTALNSAYDKIKTNKVYADCLLSFDDSFESHEESTIKMLYDQGNVYTSYQTNFGSEETWNFKDDPYTYKHSINLIGGQTDYYTKCKTNSTQPNYEDNPIEPFQFSDFESYDLSNAELTTEETKKIINFKVLDSIDYSIEIENNFITKLTANVKITLPNYGKPYDNYYSLTITFVYNDDITTEMIEPNEFNDEETWVDVQDLIETAYSKINNAEKLVKSYSPAESEGYKTYSSKGCSFRKIESVDDQNYTNQWQINGTTYTIKCEEGEMSYTYKNDPSSIDEVAFADYSNATAYYKNENYYVNITNDNKVYNLTFNKDGYLVVNSLEIVKGESYDVITYIYDDDTFPYSFQTNFQEFPGTTGIDWVEAE